MARFLGDLRAFVNGGDTRFIYYSTHDSTLTAVLEMMESEERRHPAYASFFNFEVWDRGGELQLRVLYNGEVIKVGVCGWDEVCENVREFLGEMERFVLCGKDVEDECYN